MSEKTLGVAVAKAQSFFAAPDSHSWIQLSDLHQYLNDVVDSVARSPLLYAMESENIDFLKRARCAALKMLTQP